MNRFLPLLAPAVLLLAACAGHVRPDAPGCTGRVIKKKPVSREEKGPVIVYTYEYIPQGTGCEDYQLAVVPNPESRETAAPLLKQAGFIGGPEYVSTLADRVNGDTAPPEFKEPRVARMTEDLRKYAAILERYVAAPAAP